MQSNCVMIMASQYSSNYFENNFKRLIGLKLYAMSHEKIDKINLKTASDIANGLKVKSVYNRNEHLEMLCNTVNKHFGGLECLRVTPFWQLHIVVAMAVFDNRLQIAKSGQMINDLEEKNPINLMVKLLDLKDNVEALKLNLKEMEKIYNAEQQRTNKDTGEAGYNIACCLLNRIPKLQKDEVKQLCLFIVNWMMNCYNKMQDEQNCIDVETVVKNFENKYDEKILLQDLGPEAKADIKESSCAISQSSPSEILPRPERSSGRPALGKRKKTEDKQKPQQLNRKKRRRSRHQVSSSDEDGESPSRKRIVPTIRMELRKKPLAVQSSPYELRARSSSQIFSYDNFSSSSSSRSRSRSISEESNDPLDCCLSSGDNQLSISGLQQELDAETEIAANDDSMTQTSSDSARITDDLFKKNQQGEHEKMNAKKLELIEREKMVSVRERTVSEREKCVEKKEKNLEVLENSLDEREKKIEFREKYLENLGNLSGSKVELDDDELLEDEEKNKTEENGETEVNNEQDSNGIDEDGKQFKVINCNTSRRSWNPLTFIFGLKSSSTK